MGHRLHLHQILDNLQVGLILPPRHTDEVLNHVEIVACALRRLIEVRFPSLSIPHKLLVVPFELEGQVLALIRDFLGLVAHGDLFGRYVS